MQKELGLTKKMLESVKQLAPEYTQAYYMTAVTAAQLGDRADALKNLDEVLRLDSGNRDALQLKEALLATSGQKPKVPVKEQPIGPDATVSERLQRAYQRLVDKKYQEAETIYRDILAKEPANLTALRTLISLLLEQKREQDARKVYDAARAAAPDNSQIRQMELAFTGGMTPEQRDQKILEVIRGETDEYARSSQLFVYYVTRQKTDEAQEDRRRDGEGASGGRSCRLHAVRAGPASNRTGRGRRSTPTWRHARISTAPRAGSTAPGWPWPVATCRRPRTN